MTQIKFNSVDELRTYYLESCKFLNVSRVSAEAELYKITLSLYLDDPDFNDWVFAYWEEQDIKADSYEEAKKATTDLFKKWGFNPNKGSWKFITYDSWAWCLRHLANSFLTIQNNQEGYREAGSENCEGERNVRVAYDPDVQLYRVRISKRFSGPFNDVCSLFFTYIENSGITFDRITVITNDKEETNSRD